MKTALNSLAKQNPLMLAAGIALLVGVVYYLARKTVKDVADAAGGILSGDNALTEGTPYQGAGVLGTLGAAANSVLPFLDDVGSWIGGLGNNSAGESIFYVVLFPDGRKHAVASLSVARDGAFTYDGRRYILGKNGDAWVARAVT